MSLPETYKIIRYYQRNGKQTVRSGLTLEQAQSHCNDPETSSTTAVSPSAKRRTRQAGPWFDGFQKERS